MKVKFYKGWKVCKIEERVIKMEIILGDDRMKDEGCIYEFTENVYEVAE